MLNDKVILITGAKGGLGNFVTREFLDAGARVVGAARTISNEDFPHPRFSAIAGDLNQREQAQALVQKVIAECGKVDVLVHLVGTFTGGQAVADVDEAAFHNMLNVNLLSFFHMAQAVLPGMQQQRSGTVLAIGSRTAVEPAATLGVYSASKAALVSLVRTIALENKTFGISANVILPGTMDTPVNRAAMPAVDPATWVQPRQVASMLLHLASGTSSQVTGAVIPIYGSEL